MIESEEPRIRTKESATAGVPTVVPGSAAPELGWELLHRVPEAVTAAVANVPSIVVWHFQLADTGAQPAPPPHRLIRTLRQSTSDHELTPPCSCHRMQKGHFWAAEMRS